MEKFLKYNTTLLFTDIAGYTRLMEEDEVYTRREVNNIYQNYVWPQLAEYTGQTIHHVGDGCFLEFANAKNAVLYSLNLRRQLNILNEGRERSRVVEMRIGIHYGSATYNSVSKSIDGPEVNFASRLENIGDTGGIWVSEQLKEKVGETPEIEFVCLGSRRLKHFTLPTPVYGVLSVEDKELKSRYASYSVGQFTTLTPIVAVLPIWNTSGLKAQKYLGAPLVERLKTELGRYSEITILPQDFDSSESLRNMSNQTRGKLLGADYVTDGSITKVENKYDIHVRFHDVKDNKLLWAKDYFGEVSDLLELNIELAKEVSRELPTHLERAVLKRARNKDVESLDAFDNYLLGREQYRLKTREGDISAINLLKRSINQDNTRADAYSVLGAIYGINWTYSKWGINPAPDILEGRRLIRNAIQLDDDLGRAYAHKAWTYLSMGDYEEVLPLFEKALSCNGNDVDVLLLKAFAILYLGRAEESIDICNVIKKLNPGHPELYDDVLGAAYFMCEKYDEALPYLEKVVDGFPENYAWLAATQAYLGMDQEPQLSLTKFVEEIRKVWKGDEFSTSTDYANWLLYIASPFINQYEREKLAKGIRLAGISGAGKTEGSDLPYHQHYQRIAQLKSNL